MTLKRCLTAITAILCGLFPLLAQQQADTDSLVRLMSAQSVHVVQGDTGSYREVIGPARFLHNNTYLVCDTAIWHVDEAVINAYGHVQILQDETVLSSDKLDYFVDEDRAEFRGGVVQLQDKQNNTLRTRNLDYNTRDSVAVFRQGASMRDKDGQIMESTDGTYDSKTKIFDFVWNVNMFLDSVFVKTEHLRYYGDTETAEFDTKVYAWQDDKMLSAEYGRYSKADEEYFFHDTVHVMSEDQEGWCDSLYFYRVENRVEMRGAAQVLDTTRNVMAVADFIQYVDSLSTVDLQKNAAVAAVTDQDGVVDTLYVGSDHIVYKGIRKCDIPEGELQASQKRLSDMNVDPVAEYRGLNTPPQGGETTEAAPAEEAASAGEEPAPGKESGSEEEVPADEGTGDGDAAPEEEAEPDAVAELELEPEAQQEPQDTTKIGWIVANGNVKMFRSDMQAKCDSLEFFQLDSIVRLYTSPVVWSEKGAYQYSADSIAVRIADGYMQQANLMSNAFVVIQEDEVSYDQIKSTEMMAYFDSTSALNRFDALGGASALFYLEENEALATVNKVECRMLSAYLSGGELERIYYFDNPKNNAYPVVKLPQEERELKGFNWRGGERPVNARSVTPLAFRSSQRASYDRIKRGDYKQTDRFFPGYMKDVYAHIAQRDSIRAARQLEEDTVQPEELERLDSLAANPPEGLVEPETAQEVIEDQPVPEEPQEPEEEEKPQEIQQQAAPSDSSVTVISFAEKREQKRDQRISEREKRWEELDKRDAEKAEIKAQKAAQRTRAQKLKLIRSQEKRAAKEQKILDRYIKRYEKQKARKEAATQRKAE